MNRRTWVSALLMFAFVACSFPTPQDESREGPSTVVPPRGDGGFDAGHDGGSASTDLCPPIREALSGSTFTRTNHLYGESRFARTCEDDQGRSSEYAYSLHFEERTGFSATADNVYAEDAGAAYLQLHLLKPMCQVQLTCDTQEQYFFTGRSDAFIYEDLEPGDYLLVVDGDRGTGIFELTGRQGPISNQVCEAAPVLSAAGQKVSLVATGPADSFCGLGESAAAARFSPASRAAAVLRGNSVYFRDTCGVGTPDCEGRLAFRLLDAGQSAIGFAANDGGEASLHPIAALTASSFDAPQHVDPAPSLFVTGPLAGTSTNPTGCSGFHSGAVFFSFDLVEATAVRAVAHEDGLSMAFRRPGDPDPDGGCAEGTSLIEESLPAGRHVLSVGGMFPSNDRADVLLETRKLYADGGTPCTEVCSGATPYCVAGTCRACFASAQCALPTLCCNGATYTCAVAAASCL